MNQSVKIKLSFMMFLQFFIWGAWFVTLGTFLSKNMGASGFQIGQAFGTQSWGAMIAPFFIGLIADRYFNAEKILGILHLIGAMFMVQMAHSDDFSSFYPYVFLYMVSYMPTLALVNAIAFRQMTDPAKEFSNVRVFGTIGWVVAGLCISYLFSWDSTTAIENGQLRNTFYLGAICSGILGLLSFFLPSTPPVRTAGEKPGIGQLLGLEALQLLKERNFLIFFISSILICIPLAFYYANANPFLVDAGMNNPTGTMTLGQISEIFFMLILPLFFKKYGFKKTILAGMFAWGLRYVLFAYGDAGSSAWMLISGIVLHGICYDFFFVSGQIYTDAKAGARFKSAAQGMITLATYGLGMLIGFTISGKVVEMYAGDWKMIWLLPAVFSALVLLLFAATFRDEKVEFAS